MEVQDVEDLFSRCMMANPLQPAINSIKNAISELDEVGARGNEIGDKLITDACDDALVYLNQALKQLGDRLNADN